MSWNRQHGLTLVELMVSVAITAILVSMGVPSFQQLSQNNRLVAGTNTLLAALNLARNEALSRGRPVSVCASADGATCADTTNWVSGWVVFVDSAGAAGSVDTGDAVLRSYASLSGGETLSASAAFVQYLPTGFVASTGATSFQLRPAACSAATGGRDLSVALQGRASVAKVPCP